MTRRAKAGANTVELTPRAAELVDAEVARQNRLPWRSEEATRASVIEQWAEMAKNAADQF